MEDCSSWDTHQWSNIHHGLEISSTPVGSFPSLLITDPVEELQECQHRPTNINALSSHLMMNQHSSDFPLMLTPLSGLMGNRKGQLEAFDRCNGSSSGSMEHHERGLECLTNSNTDTTNTSVEDDGISVILSDCKNLWNFTENPSPDNVTTTSSKKRCFSLIQDPPQGKERKRLRNSGSANISFSSAGSSSMEEMEGEPDPEVIQQMKEMIYRAAAFRPVNFGVELVEKPKRKNVRISDDPQTVAARHRRERISERLRVLQKLVPGGSKMDTATMLDEAANYLKFLRNQVNALEALGNRLHHYHNYLPPTTTCSSTTHYCPPVFNLQFSPMPVIPMQPEITPPLSLIQNPNQLHKS